MTPGAALLDSLPRARLLLIGARQEISRRYARRLQAGGYVLQQASSLAEAAGILQSERFQVLLTWLPVSSADELELAELGVRHSLSGGAPVIVCFDDKEALPGRQPRVFVAEPGGGVGRKVLESPPGLGWLEEALASYRKRQEFACLSGMVPALLETEDLREAAALVVEQGKGLVGAERGWLRVGATEGVCLRKYFASRCPEMRRENLQALEDCLLRVNGNGAEDFSYFNNEVRSNRKLAEAAAAAGVESLASVPLRHGNDLVGRMWLCNKRGGFTAMDAELLEWFAGHAAAVLAGARRWQDLRLRAMTDGLTGLFNYRAFQTQLQHEIARVGRTGRVLTLLVIDVDGLKGINDRFGHLVGDEVIRSVARTIQENARAADITARWGGGEFLLLMADTPLEQAGVVGERLRQKIFSLRVDPVPQVSASIGCCCYPRHADSAGELIEVADRVLYEAKQRGGNCLVLAHLDRMSAAI